MTREKQIEYFKGCLMATGREGVEDLLDFIEELGFYDAPASGGNHCCKDGGLLEHTVNVMQYAEKIGLTLLGILIVYLPGKQQFMTFVYRKVIIM